MNLFTTDKSILIDGEVYQIILKNGDKVKQVIYQKEGTGQDGNPALFYETDTGPESYSYSLEDDVLIWRVEPYRQEKRDIMNAIVFAMADFIDDDSLLSRDMLEAIIDKCNDLIKSDF